MATETNKEITELEKEIRYHQDLYYNKQPEISDEDFDILWDRLKRLDPNNELFKTVGADVETTFKKARHIIPMGSQEKAANNEQFMQWAQKKDFSTFIVQYKLDGASVELQYTNGIFTKAVTRGDGTIGDDITENVKRMQGVVFALKNDQQAVPFTGGIRGEILMTHHIHEKFYSDKANCRNAANGVMKRKDGSGSEHLTIICYDALSADDARNGTIQNEFFSNELEKMKWLQAIGCNTVPQTICDGIQAVIEYRVKVMSIRASLDYDIDGLVIKNTKIDLADANRARPEKQIAFKFSLEEAISTVRQVEWSESGATYTPIAIIDPVRLAGTTVKRASLANPRVIKNLQLKIGSQVVVTKRGEIIPKIEALVSNPADATEIPIPSVCSTCSTPLINDETRLYCPNPACEKKLHHRLEKWTAVLDIQELGVTLLQRLFDSGKVRSITQLYALTADDLIQLDRMGTVLAEKVIRSIQSKREMSLAQMIAGFDIEGIGEVIAEKIVSAGYNTLDKILNATEEELSKIFSVGEILAHNFVTGIQQVSPEMQKLVASGTIVLKQTAANLAGKNFCFTGELKTLKRVAAEQMVKDKGGAVKSSVTKDLTYLVTNDTTSGSAKNLKAQQLGISIIDEQKFLELVGEP